MRKSGKKKGEGRERPGNTYHVSDASLRWMQSEHRWGEEGPHSNNKLDFMIELLGKTPDVHKIANTLFDW